jgi:copper(I)-binding protein
MIRRILLVAALAAATMSPALAHDFTIGTLAIAHPFMRETPPGIDTGAAYMTITNSGTVPDRLVAVEVDPAIAKAVEFHQTVVTNGVAAMQPVVGGFEIVPGGETVIGDDGTHVMLSGISRPVRKGEKVAATLIFEKAGRLNVFLAVEALGKMTNEHDGGHGN